MSTRVRALAALVLCLLIAAPASAVVAGYLVSWHVQVTTTATLVKPPSGTKGILVMECMAPESAETGATTLIAAGGPNVNPAAGAARNGAIFCGSGCRRGSAKAGATGMYLRAASGTVEISCWGITAGP